MVRSVISHVLAVYSHYMNLALDIHINKQNSNSRETAQQQLIQGCIAQNRLYQKKLYEVYYGKMMPVCLRYTGSYEEARDVLHEGFMKVYKNIAKFEPRHSLESWIKRIMINTAIDHYRKNKKHSKQVDINYASYEADKGAVSVVSKLSAEEILGLVQQLSPAYRTVFSLYVIEGYKHREIATMLGVSEGSSKSNLAKARAKLRAMIKEQLPHYQYYSNG